MFTLVHAALGLALGYAAAMPLLFAFAGAWLPDIDIMWAANPALHRQFFHTPFMGMLLSVAVYAVFRKRDRALSFFLGWTSHLFGDTLTVFGIMWLYPLSNAYVSTGTTTSSSMAANVTMLFASGIIVYATRLLNGLKIRRANSIRGFWRAATPARKALALIAVMLAAVAVGAEPRGAALGDTLVLSIDGLLHNPDAYAEKPVTTSGTVSGKLEDYVARSGISYKRFRITDGSGELLVFAATGANGLSKGDRVSVSGTFRTRYEEPEIYISPYSGSVRRT